MSVVISVKEQARRVKLAYRNIVRAAIRRRKIEDYKKFIAEFAGRIIAEEYGGAPKLGHRPPGVVVLDSDATPAGTPDLKHYRTINARIGLSATDDNDRVDLDVRVGGVFCIDYLVNTSWATEVSAGRGTEGEEIDGGFGGTFRVYSEPLAAQAHALANRTTADDGVTFLVCGQHTLTGTLEMATGGNTQIHRWVGINRNSSAFITDGSNDTVNINGEGAGSGTDPVFVVDHLGVSTLSTALIAIDVEGGAAVRITDVLIKTNNASAKGIRFQGLDINEAWVKDSWFTGAAAAQVDLDGSAGDAKITHNLFQGAATMITISNAANFEVEQNIFSGFTTAAIVITGNSNETNASISHNRFVHGSSSIGINFPSGTNIQAQLRMNDNTFMSIGASSAGIDFSSMNSSGLCFALSIQNNTFSCTAQNATAFGINGPTGDFVRGSIVSGNIFRDCKSGNEYNNWGNGTGNEAYHNKSMDDDGSVTQIAVADVGSPVGHVTGGDSHDHSGGDGAQIDHGGLAGLSDDDHSIYALLAGRSGGQTLIGGTGGSDSLVLRADSGTTGRDITVAQTGDVLQLVGLDDTGISLKQLGGGPADPYTATIRVNNDGNNAELNFSLIGSGTGPSNIRFLLDGSQIFTFQGTSLKNVASLSFGNSNDGFIFTDDLASPTERRFEVIVNSETIMRHTNPNTGDSFIESVGWRPFTDAAEDWGTASKRWKDGFFSGTIRSSSSPTSIQIGGSINVGTDAAADTSSSIDLTANDRAMLLNRLTTTQRDNLTPVNGMEIYNSTLNKFQLRENGAWISIGSQTLLVDADGDTKVQVEESADEDIIRFDAEGNEMMTIGFLEGVDIFHTAAASDEHALEIVVDAAGQGDIKGVEVRYDTGAIASGEDEAVILVEINELDANGGEVYGLEVLSTDGGADAIYGMKVGAVVAPILQDSGTFANPTTGTNNTASTDVPAMIDGSEGTNTTIFVANTDFIIIGAAAAFTEIEFDIQTGASNPGIKPTFAYSTTGSGQFTTFTPVDGTDGFRATGVVAWDAADLTGHVANSDTGTFDIKITRTSSPSGSVSLFFAKTAATVVFQWDKDGRVFIKGEVIGHTAQITAAVASEFQILGTDTPTSSMILGRFSAGTSAPIITFVKGRGSIGATTIVEDGDRLGQVRFLAADGADLDTVVANVIVGVDDGSPAAGDIGADYVMQLMPGGGGALRNVMRIAADGELQLPLAEASGLGLLLGTTSPVEIFRSAANTLRLDTKVSNAYMTIDGTTQTFGSAITIVNFLHASQVDFTNAAGFEVVRFADTNTTGGPAVVFATNELQVNEDIDISGHIAIGASASVDTKVGSVLVIAETSTATDTRAGASGLINQLSITHTYTPASASSSAFRGLFMKVEAGGDENVSGVFLAGAGSLQFVTQHDSDGTINNITGAAGQCIVGNNPLDAISTKTPTLDTAFSQGIGVQGAFIWSSHSGSTGNITLDAGSLGLGVKAVNAALTLRTFQTSGTITMKQAWGVQVQLNINNQGASVNKITITDLIGIGIENASSSSSVTVTTGKLLKLAAWDSDATYTNGPYGISQEGTGDVNWIAGYTYIGGASIPSLALANNAALTVDQDASGGAIPVLTLDQADVSEEMMEFITTIGIGNAIEAIGAKTLTTTHFIKVTIPGGLTRYIPVGTIA